MRIEVTSDGYAWITVYRQVLRVYTLRTGVEKGNASREIVARPLEREPGAGVSRTPISVPAWLPGFAEFCGVIVSLGSVVVLVGWALGIPTLIRLLPTTVAMNPLTALTFFISGVGLSRAANRETRKREGIDVLPLIIGVIILAVGALKLADYMGNLHLGMDKLLFSWRIKTGHPLPPNEIAPNTALCFVFCGASMALLDVETRRGFRPAQALILCASLIALLALIGYGYRVLSFYKIGAALPMALPTALSFALLCTGLFAARPRGGLMEVVTSPTTGGAIARRLLPMALMIPWVLGALLLAGVKGGYYEQEFAVSIFAISSIVVFSGFIWWNAKLLYTADLERALTEKRLGVQHNANRILAEAPAGEDVLGLVLEAIGEACGADGGAAWLTDKSANTARCVHVWQQRDVTLEPFLSHSRQTLLTRGLDIPGRVYESRATVWIENILADTNFPRKRVAEEIKLQTVFAFPILAGPEVYGIMEFFFLTPQSRDEVLLEMLKAIGSQLGQFVERQRAQEMLKETSANLERSNTDLQQFAYVASHDLFEPLRMVISYLQLLNERYRPKLDPTAQEFFGFAIDGAKRMQALIADLLEYSRVDIRGKSFEPVEGEAVLAAALSNLKVAIEENKAVIEHKPLPRVMGDSVQLTQVFQNLIGNAIKFHGAKPPHIDVGAARQNGEWLLWVRDNGIGIEPKHFERIFIIFQRLHTRQEYSGTGMGLAIVKKIIERHGGRIWVESAPSQGSVFYFTLPVMKGG